VLCGLLLAPDRLIAVIGLAAGAGALALLSARRARAARTAAWAPADGAGTGGRRSGPAAAAGVVLGVDGRGRALALEDRQLAAHALIVGASGSGKSTTLVTILSDQIRRGRPVIAIDLKGSPAFARQLRDAATAAGRGLRVWTPDGPGHWNPLAHGNATALKDRLIATERFTEPHYRRAAERYVQTALQVLQAAHPDREIELAQVVAMMEPRRLGATLRAVPEPLAERVQDYLAGLTPDQVSAVRGLGTRLALLSESSAGPYLTAGDPDRRIDLGSALDGGDVILLSLNSSVYGALAGQLGTLAIQDIISAAGRRLERDAPVTPATVAIDEFSALDSDNLIALLARGREAGVSVALVTQELADLDRAAHGFRDQVLGNTAVKIAHRQDVPGSAFTIAQMAGTERVIEQTENVRPMFGSPGTSLGTRREAERFVVDPNEIKSLGTGQAVVLVKIPRAAVMRARVTAPPAPRRIPPGRDQPAPGVTR
jgi:type IV secretory pathway TraG/TraD family ATPase VirD4